MASPSPNGGMPSGSLSPLPAAFGSANGASGSPSDSQMAGFVLSDAHGLCLRAEGDLSALADDQSAGFFASLARRAVDLQQLTTTTHASNERDSVVDQPETSEDTGEHELSGSTGTLDLSRAPIVRLETSTRDILVSLVPLANAKDGGNANDADNGSFGTLAVSKLKRVVSEFEEHHA